MRLPTFRVIDGVVDEKSTAKDIIALTGAGHPQPIPNKELLGKEAIGYLGDCIYKTHSSDLDIQRETWTFEMYALIGGTIVFVSSHDAAYAPGGWYIAVHSGGAYLYRTSAYKTGIRTMLSSKLQFPKTLRAVKPKLYSLVKKGNLITFYIDSVSAGAIVVPVTSKMPGFSFFGMTQGKQDTFSSASTLQCNYINFLYGYAATVSEFTKFKSELTREEAYSFLDPDSVPFEQFSFEQMLGVRTFAPELQASDYAKAAGIIPHMSANTVGLYTVGASDILSASYPAWAGFPTFVDSGRWSSSLTATPKWLQVARNDDAAFFVNAFSVSVAANGGGVPRNYSLQGKNSADLEWTTIYTVEDAPDAVGGKSFYYGFGVFQYSMYRLYITVWDGSYVSIGKFQLMYAETIPGSKAFEFQGDGKEILPVGASKGYGNYIKGATLSQEALPRTLNIKLNDDSIIPAGVQDWIDGGRPYPWGDGSGYLTKNGDGEYRLKPIHFVGLATAVIDGETVVTYDRASPYSFSVDNLGAAETVHAPGQPFLAAPVALTRTPIPLGILINKYLTNVDGSKYIVAAGSYFMDGFFTVAIADRAIVQVLDSQGACIAQSQGSFNSQVVASTIQMRLRALVNFSVDTEIQFMLLSTSVPPQTAALSALASPVVTKLRHSRLNLYRV